MGFDAPSGWDRRLAGNSIETFRDALGVAMALADDYAFVNAAVLVGANGSVTGLALAEGIGRSIASVVGPVCRRLGGPLPRPVPAMAPEGDPGHPLILGRPGVAHSVLLITVRPFEVDVVRETDLDLYRRACWRFSELGVGLLDWIESDGDLFRSFAYVTCPGQAWPGDPPGHRLS